jgi:hypothetical protein
MKTLLILILLTGTAYAFEDQAFKLTKYEYKQSTEYSGKRRYSESELRNDPEVLVSTPNRAITETPTTYKAKPEDTIIMVKPDHKPIIVKTQFCDDTSCGEWKEQ